MTAGFGSENLFLFREGTRSLTVVDAANWRAFELDFSRLGLGLAPECLEEMSSAVREASVRALEDAKRREKAAEALEAAGSRVKRSAEALGRLVARRAALDSEALALAPTATGLLAPLQATFWLASADGPAETFHAEDYEPGALEPLDPEGAVEPVDYSASFQELGMEPHLYPLGPAGGRAALSLPKGFAQEFRPDPLEALPILNDYVGPGGVGVEGFACNLDDAGAFSSEAWAALPLVREGWAFHTLYVHLNFGEVPAGVAKVTKGSAKGAEAARKALREAGFEEAGAFGAARPAGERSGARCEVWTRGSEADVFHLYENFPGREALGRSASPPLLLSVRAGGSFAAQARAGLLLSVLAPRERS